MFNLWSEILLGCDIILDTNLSSDNGLSKSKPRVRFEGIERFGDGSCESEVSQLTTNGFNFRFILCGFRSKFHSFWYESTTCVAFDSVSDFWFNQNKPWVRGEVQLTQKSVAFPSYGICLYDLTRSSVNQKAPTYLLRMDKQSCQTKYLNNLLGDILSVERLMIE